MKVIAIERGYSGLAIREPGDVFDVPAEMDHHEFVIDKEGTKRLTGKVTKKPHTATWFKKAEDDTKGPQKADTIA